MGHCVSLSRYFRSDAAAYEALRLQLDAAWGYGLGTGTVTCVEPAATAPRDGEGRVVLSVRAEFPESHAETAMLPQLLASNAVEEIDEATYFAAAENWYSMP